MMKQTKQHHIDELLALLLLGVFAVCVLSVLLSGAGAYRRLIHRDSASYDHRTAAQYLTTRVRQADAAGRVSATDFDQALTPEAPAGGDTLVLAEDIDGTTYYTLVYCHDGYIRELFTAGDWALSPADGEQVLEAQALTFGWSGDGLLTAELTAADGTTEQIILSLRSGKEAAS